LFSSKSSVPRGAVTWLPVFVSKSTPSGTIQADHRTIIAEMNQRIRRLRSAAGVVGLRLRQLANLLAALELRMCSRAPSPAHVERCPAYMQFHGAIQNQLALTCES
jgi:hypothetical protein